MKLGKMRDYYSVQRRPSYSTAANWAGLTELKNFVKFRVAAFRSRNGPFTIPSVRYTKRSRGQGGSLAHPAEADSQA